MTHHCIQAPSLQIAHLRFRRPHAHHYRPVPPTHRPQGWLDLELLQKRRRLVVLGLATVALIIVICAVAASAAGGAAGTCGNSDII